MQQINVILPAAYADYVGPLPAELQATSISLSVCWRCRRPMSRRMLKKEERRCSP
jgi:hypothetical protein